MEDRILNLTDELLKLLEIDAEVKVTTEEDCVNVVIDATEEAGLLIGGHGSTLAAIQSFLNIAVKQATGEWTRINVDIGDWRAKHDTELEELAEQAAMRARETGEDQHLYNLNAGQRRIVHMALSKQKNVVTESVGEGPARYLVVKPTSK